MSSSSVESSAATSVRTVGFLLVLLTAGCAGLDRAPPPQSVTQAEVVADEQTVADDPVVHSVTPAVTAEPEVYPPVVSTVAEPVADSAPPPVVAEPLTRPATPSAPRATDTSIAKTQAASAKPPAQPPAAPVLAEPPQKKESTPRTGQQQAALDMAALEKRLRETKAIGVFTKITLKNQVDDLLNQFRAFYQGRAKATLAELRQAYDRLLLKVLSLLQDGDRSLASEIVASRDAIWGILSDPVKFASL
ncbi:MAG: hypothetical protein Q8L89_05160 [Gammaproteobacteria bacterium]|nr:hypothetical protein [Gammaproteobacteria bacterium]